MWLTPCVASWTISSPPTHPTVAAWGSIALWFW